MTGGTAPVRRRRRSESEVVPHPRDGAYMQTFFSKLVKFIATDMQPIKVVENEGTRFKNYKIEKDELSVELSNFSLCDVKSDTLSTRPM